MRTPEAAAARLREIPEPVAGPLALYMGEALDVSSAILAAGGRHHAGPWGDDGPTSSPPYQRCGSTAYVAVDGLLLMRGGWMFSGHEQIRDACLAAIADPNVTKIGLRITSPGGVVAGNFEAVETVRAAAAAAGKTILAHSKAVAASAAYAWACAASKVYLSRAACMGSVGVVSGLTSVAEANKRMGIDERPIASGDRKLDGNPDVPITEGAIEARKATVEYLADLFAGLVATARGMTSADVRAQQAAVYYGPAAVTAGLADGVLDEDDFEALCEGRADTKPGDMHMEKPGTPRANAGDDTNIMAAMRAEVQAEIAGHYTAFLAGACDALGLPSGAPPVAILDAVKRAVKTRDENATAFADYIASEAVLAGKAKTDDAARLRAAMVDDRNVARPLALRDHFAAIPRGAALPAESFAPPGGPETRGPSAAGNGKLDGAKMTATQIAAHYGTPDFARLMAEHTAATKGEIAALLPRAPGAPAALTVPR